MRTQSSRRATAAGVGNLTVAEAAVERARESLKSAQRYLETEGSDALQRAIQRSEKFGQQSERMSQIARDARQAADTLDDAAALIDSTAQEALNTSSSAYQLAREAVDQQKNSTEEIGGLRKELTITEQTLARTQAMAKEALTNAQSAYTEALSLLGDAYSLVVPNVEWQFMKRQAAQHSEESRQIKTEADQLAAENANMLDKLVTKSLALVMCWPKEWRSSKSRMNYSLTPMSPWEGLKKPSHWAKKHLPRPKRRLKHSKVFF